MKPELYSIMPANQEGDRQRVESPQSVLLTTQTASSEPSTNSAKTTLHLQTEAIPAPLEIHPSVSPLAAKLLLNVCEMLSARPSDYNQHEPCGSKCCIIGHMEAQLGILSKPEALGLTRKQYTDIFRYEDWPEGFFCGNPRARVSASKGIARIEHFLRTGE